MINLILFISIFPATLLRGLVLTKLWGWFLVPLGVVAINITVAIGISIIAACLTHQSDTDDITDEEKVKIIVFAFIHPLFFWLYGWIVQLFI